MTHHWLLVFANGLDGGMLLRSVITEIVVEILKKKVLVEAPGACKINVTSAASYG
jgi:hypothetical protein